MDSNSEKGLPLSDVKKLGEIKADLASRNYEIRFSDVDGIIKRPLIKKLKKQMARERDWDELRRLLPAECDVERYINLVRKNMDHPGLVEDRERLFNHFLGDPQNVDSKTPLDVKPAGHEDAFYKL